MLWTEQYADGMGLNLDLKDSYYVYGAASAQNRFTGSPTETTYTVIRMSGQEAAQVRQLDQRIQEGERELRSKFPNPNSQDPSYVRWREYLVGQHQARRAEILDSHQDRLTIVSGSRPYEPRQVIPVPEFNRNFPLAERQDRSDRLLR